ncbi:MBL fold metallo-hydrolase [Anaerovibrio slackiae]|uniref:MBL fold metallo-hydrolase n=1 Tax=Anaerovibrio slackiae TaxID=2652309 RepID=UPI00386FD832
MLHQLKHAGIDWKSIRNIFVTHKHIDHITGVLWIIRMICQYMNQGEYEGEATIYAHDEVIGLLQDLSEKLLQKEETDFI